MEVTTQELLNIAYKKHDCPEKSELVMSDLPDGIFVKLDLNKFQVFNASGFTTQNCNVWFPKKYSEHLKSKVKFYIRSNLKNCNFFFFAIPHKRSELKFSIKGENHTGVFFSANQMKFTAKMVGSNNFLTIGENCYIGGATIVLNSTLVTIGADGLWSDGILLQGSDSHGIVDLETMKVTNQGATHITLKRHVWIGRQATLTKNITINEGSIIATSAVITKDVEPGCVVAGVPAKVVKKRVSWSRRMESISDYEKKTLTKLRNRIDGIEETNSSFLQKILGKK